MSASHCNFRIRILEMSACPFYSELQKLSTADLYSSNKRKRRRLEYGGNYFSVGRLLAVKVRDKVIYLEITTLHIRSYKLVSCVFVVKSSHGYLCRKKIRCKQPYFEEFRR